MNPRILLVEDDPTSRAFLQAATESLPATVDAAAGVAEAVAIAAGHAHALWLIDANLPDGSGSALLATLRAQGLSTPAIAHTAARDIGEHDALLAAGFAATLAKPLSTADWLAAIRGVLGDDRAPDALQESELAARPCRFDAVVVWDDAAALAALAGNPDSVAALRRLFLDELPEARDSVREAASKRDDDALHAALHKLRASCGFVGAARLDATATALRAEPASASALQAFLDAAQDTLSSP